MEMLKNNAKNLWILSTRNLKIFLRDKPGVLFAFLAPLLILLLYVVFLKEIQATTLKGILDTIPMLVYSPGDVDDLLTNWLISGVLSVSIFTIALNSMGVMVQDRIQKMDQDLLVAPVSGTTLYLSYFISSLIITFALSMCVFIISEIYLLAIGGTLLSFAALCQFLPTLALSCIFSSLFAVLLVLFVKSETVFSSIAAMMSAMLGFIIGAYMPISMFPNIMQNICNIFPGSHTSALFRNIFMSEPMNNLFVNAPDSAKESIIDAYSLELNMFGTNVGTNVMYGFLAGAVVIFGVLALLLFNLRRKQKLK